ncbi:hypothetical protein [Microcystis phage Mel-JY01]
MIYTIYPNFDATIYERFPDKNTGTDSILELVHEATPSGSIYNSRILIKFDVDGIREEIQNGKISNNADYYLSLKTSGIYEIPQEYTIYAFPASSSWANGTGTYKNFPNVTDGVSWKYRFSKQSDIQWEVPPLTTAYEWDDITETWIESTFTFGTLMADVSSSYYTNVGGGNWWIYDNIECTQSFSFQSSDVYMDVGQIVRKWITGSGRIQNDGFLIKYSDEHESSNYSLSGLQFYSADSNTIYVPRLYVVWDDSEFNTGSLLPANIENTNINVKLKKYYSEKERTKIRIFANEKYPRRQYTTQSYYTRNFFLPESSYYEIRDAHTDEVFIPFDDIGTKISCDSTGSYFNIWMDNFQPERFYRIVLKIVDNDEQHYLDNSFYFKVTR